jgi:dCTP deaminase
MLSAQSIRERTKDPDPARVLVIEPFRLKGQVNGRSYGLASASYDVCLRETIVLWPFWGRLASIMEYLAIPHDLSAEVKDKSSNARIFVLVQNTFIDPGWRGYLTVELTRFLPWPIVLRAGTPIAQIVFHQLDEATDHPYSGKYQEQSPGPKKAIFEK